MKSKKEFTLMPQHDDSKGFLAIRADMLAARKDLEKQIARSDSDLAKFDKFLLSIGVATTGVVKSVAETMAAAKEDDLKAKPGRKKRAKTGKKTAKKSAKASAEKQPTSKTLVSGSVRSLAEGATLVDRCAFAMSQRGPMRVASVIKELKRLHMMPKVKAEHAMSYIRRTISENGERFERVAPGVYQVKAPRSSMSTTDAELGR